jgi:hypothetical protein
MGKASAQAQAAAKALPAPQDVGPVTASLEPAKAVEQWKAAAVQLAGPEERSRVQSLFDTNTTQLTRFAQVMSSAAGGAPPSKANEADLLWGPLMQSVQMAYPSAQLTLVAPTKGSINEPGLETSAALEVTLPTRGNQSKTYTLGMNPSAFLSQAGGDKIVKAVLASPSLSQTFMQTVAQLSPNAVGPNAQITLEALNTPQTRMALALAVLSMPPAAQADLFKAMGPEAKGASMGNFVTSINLKDPEQVLVGLDPTPLLMGQQGKSLQTNVCIAPGDDGSRAFKFYKQYGSAALAPAFYQMATMKSAVQTLSVSGLAIENFVANNFAVSQDIANNIRHTITASGAQSAQVTALPIFLNAPGNPGGQPAQLTLFKIDTPKGEQYVDQDGRTYVSFNDWRMHNQLPPGTVTYLNNGDYALKGGKLDVRTQDTPNTPDGFWKKLNNIVGVATMPVIIGSIIASEAFPIAGMLEAGLGVGGILTSGVLGWQTGSQLYDMGVHGQSLSPIHTPQLWDSYLMLGSMVGGYASAGLARVGAMAGGAEGSGSFTQAIFGPTGAMTETAGRGSQIVNKLSVASGVALVANMDREMVTQWNQLSPKEKAMELVQNGIFSASTIVGLGMPMQREAYHQWLAEKFKGRVPGMWGYVPTSKRVTAGIHPEGMIGSDYARNQAMEKHGLTKEQLTFKDWTGLVRSALIPVKYHVVGRTAEGVAYDKWLKPSDVVNGQLRLPGLKDGEVLTNVTITASAVRFENDAQGNPVQVAEGRNKLGRQKAKQYDIQLTPEPLTITAHEMTDAERQAHARDMLLQHINSVKQSMMQGKNKHVTNKSILNREIRLQSAQAAYLAGARETLGTPVTTVHFDIDHNVVMQALAEQFAKENAKEGTETRYVGIRVEYPDGNRYFIPKNNIEDSTQWNLPFPNPTKVVGVLTYTTKQGSPDWALLDPRSSQSGEAAGAASAPAAPPAAAPAPTPTA